MGGVSDPFTRGQRRGLLWERRLSSLRADAPCTQLSRRAQKRSQQLSPGFHHGYLLRSWVESVLICDYHIAIILHIAIQNTPMKAITFRLPEQELETLQAYCEQEGRNQTDVLREYIRSLKRKIKPDDKD